MQQKQYDQAIDANEYNELLEFKSSNTYITSTGTWSVSGNQLTMIAPAEQKKGMKGRISNFSITGNKMTRTVIAEPPYNKTRSKTEETSIRM